MHVGGVGMKFKGYKWEGDCPVLTRMYLFHRSASFQARCNIKEQVCRSG